MNNKLKKLSTISLGALSLVAPVGSALVAAPVAFAEEGTTTSSADMGKVTYKYVDEATGKELGSGYKEGTIGEEFVINPSVIDGYELSKTEGETTGNYSNEEATITFFYKAVDGKGETAPTNEPTDEEVDPDADSESSTEETESSTDTSSESSTEDPDTSTDASSDPSTDSSTDTSTESSTDTATENTPEEPVEVVTPTVDAPIETQTGDKVIGTTEDGNVVVADNDGVVREVAPEEVGGTVESDGSISLTDSTGKKLKIPSTDAAAAIVSIMLAGGSASTAGIASFLKSKRNRG